MPDLRFTIELDISINSELDTKEIISRVESIGARRLFATLLTKNSPLSFMAGTSVQFKELHRYAFKDPNKPIDILDMEVTIDETPSSDIVETRTAIINALYEMLEVDSKQFTDWEYKFITDNYGKDLTNFTEKQEYWLNKLREKFL